MSSLHIRNGVYHISYYRGNIHYRYSLRLKANKQGYIEANKILKQIDATVMQDRLRLILFNVPEKEASLKLSEAKERFFEEKSIAIDCKGVYYSAMKYLLDIIGDVNISTITPKHLVTMKEYLLKKNKSYNTAVTYFNHLHVFFNYLIDKQLYSDKNPVPKLKYLQMKINIIEQSELQKIIDHIDSDIKYLIKFLSLTGLRISETLSLKWTDINKQQNIITLYNQKAKRNESFPLHPELQSFINTLQPKGKDDRIFNYDKRYVLKVFRKATKALKLPDYTLHDIRRTFATKYAAILTPQELKTVMRHKNINTTLNHYINLNLQTIGKKL